MMLLGTHEVNFNAQVIEFFLVLPAGLASVVGDEHDLLVLPLKDCIGIEKQRGIRMAILLVRRSRFRTSTAP
jgi:hypothetical protein